MCILIPLKSTVIHPISVKNYSKNFKSSLSAFPSLLYVHILGFYVKDLKFPIPSGIVVKLVHSPKSRVVKELKFPNPSGIVVKLEQSLKSRVVKELKFPNSSGIVVKLVHLLKSRDAKKIKFPNPSGIVVKFEQPSRSTSMRVVIENNSLGI